MSNRPQPLWFPCLWSQVKTNTQKCFFWKKEKSWKKIPNWCQTLIVALCLMESQNKQQQKSWKKSWKKKHVKLTPKPLWFPCVLMTSRKQTNKKKVEKKVEKKVAKKHAKWTSTPYDCLVLWWKVKFLVKMRKVSTSPKTLIVAWFLVYNVFPYVYLSFLVFFPKTC